ncbi:MAG: hypothetical protein QMC40_11295 [Vicingaceae bacterium]|jgi:hypothetical protein|tara:strand:+ start:1875 stop:2507 length:633 start_codon:yes stop_codon:yes gene_type:complete
MPKLNCTFFFCLVLIFVSNTKAQSFEEELKTAITKKPKLELRMDSRHSFINQTGVKTVGVKLGVQFEEKLSFGIGYNELWSPLSRIITDQGIERRVRLAFYNVSPYVEYVFFRNDKWELSIPVQFGFGSSFYKNSGNQGAGQLKKEFVISYEPAITFQYRFLKYFGAGFGIGYRLMIIPNQQLEEKFTSPVFIFKTGIYFQDVFRDLNID